MLIEFTVVYYYLYDGIGAPWTGHVKLWADDNDASFTGSTLLEVLGGEPPIGSIICIFNKLSMYVKTLELAPLKLIFQIEQLIKW